MSALLENRLQATAKQEPGRLFHCGAWMKTPGHFEGDLLQAILRDLYGGTWRTPVELPALRFGDGIKALTCRLLYDDFWFPETGQDFALSYSCVAALLLLSTALLLLDEEFSATPERAYDRES